jgi:hypothetical protein
LRSFIVKKLNANKTNKLPEKRTFSRKFIGAKKYPCKKLRKHITAKRAAKALTHPLQYLFTRVPKHIKIIIV